MKPALFLVAVLLSGCASTPASTPQGVVKMPFPIAGGKTVYLPVTNGGPVPAENDRIKIEVAGYVISPFASDPAIPALTWTFAFKTKTDQKIEQVVVEEVGGSDSAIVMLSDDRPTLEQGNWVGRTEATKADKQSVPWLYSGKSSIFVFKFAIKMQGMPAQILYQPSWFPAAAKNATVAGYGKAAGSNARTKGAAP